MTAPTNPCESALRKAAWRLLPILGAGYAVGLIDRTNVSFAALQMNRDLHFSSSVYGFGAGVFFFAYALCNVPANLVLLRVGARRWLAGIMIAWGILSAITIFVRSAGSFYLLRFLLGVAEAGFFPGVMYYLTLWFPSRMRARSITSFYAFGPISGVITGSLAGALLGLNGRLGLAGWQWLFLVEAIPAVLLGALILVRLPDGPKSASWLSAEECACLEQSFGGPIGPDRGSIAVFWRSFQNPQVWLSGLFMFCAIVGFYAYVFFAPVILERLTGWNATRVGLVVACQYAASVLAMILNGMHSDRQQERRWHAVIPCLLSTIGFITGALSHSRYIAALGLTLVPMAFWGCQGPSWAFCTGLLGAESAAIGLGAISALGILGGFAGPLLFGYARDQTGTFQTGLFLCGIPSFAAALIMHRLGRKAVVTAPP